MRRTLTGPVDLGQGSVARFLLRLAVAYLLLAGAAVTFAGPLGGALTPLVHLGLALFHPEVEVRAVSSDRGRVTADVTVRGQTGRFKARVGASAATTMVVPLLTLSVVLAWRFRTRRRKAAGLALGALFAAVVVAHDVPLAMVQGLSGKLLIGATNTFAQFFLDNSGRQILALVAAAAAIWLASVAFPRATVATSRGDAVA